MQSISTYPRTIALTLCLALPTAQLAYASPKLLTPEQARAKIQKVHLDGWVGVREFNGIEVGGRILSIDTDTFTIQTSNLPETATIRYQDVAYLRTPIGLRSALILAGVVIGAGVAGGFILHHEYENSLANQKASQDAICQANNIPLSQCAGG
ncbi:MAG TPA: hypothetical protein VH117_06930 [Edaphobacter sp.]|jgi:hypothetical protein|nr:hypothetical protein [Edaphobacter sp.]